MFLKVISSMLPKTYNLAPGQSFLPYGASAVNLFLSFRFSFCFFFKSSRAWIIESSLSIAAWHNDMLSDRFASESEESELSDESELLDECLRFFFFLSFFEDFDGALLTLLTLELVNFSS